MKIVMFLVLMLTSVCIADNCSLINEVVTLDFEIHTTVHHPNYPVILTSHTDFDVSFTSSGWNVLYSPQYGDDVALEDGLLYADPNTRIPSIPAGFEFTGAQAGEEIWVLPQSISIPVLYLGFAAEDESEIENLCQWEPNDPNKNAGSPGKWYKVRLLDVRGPQDANFSLWQTGPPTKVFMSTAWDGIGDDDVYYVSAGAGCSHPNWGFTKQGYYEIDFEISTVYSCDSWMTADLWPLGDENYHGNCIIDFYDYAVLVRNWFEDNCDSHPNLCEGADLNQPKDNQVDLKDLEVLAEQWFTCGYPGCDL